MHENPDIDSIASAYAAALFLRKKNKSVFIGIEKPIPDRYTFFIDSNDMENLFILRNNIIKDSLEWLLCVDTASPKLLNEFEPFLKHKKTLVIDHHKIFIPYGDYNLNIPHKSSTSEMMIEIIKHKNLDHLMATSLYAGIVYDTGNFKYDSTTPSLFRKAANLLEDFQIKTDEIVFNIFDNESIERKKLAALILDTLESYEENQMIVTYFPISFKKEVQADESDASDMVHVGQTVKGCLFSMFIKEREDGVSISFRTRTSFDVAVLAQTWGGGGHQKASGLKLKKITLEEVKKTLVPECAKEFKKWKEKNHV